MPGSSIALRGPCNTLPSSRDHGGGGGGGGGGGAGGGVGGGGCGVDVGPVQNLVTLETVEDSTRNLLTELTDSFMADFLIHQK